MKLAIISGGSKGLGKALCSQFKNNDYHVIEFSRSGTSSNSIKCDFKNYGESTQIVAQQLEKLCQNEYSEIVLVNNVATINPIGPVSSFSPEKYQENVTVNFLSSVMLTGVFTKYFQSHPCKKTIIYISSGAAVRAKYGWALYCGAKAGLEQFFKAYSLEQVDKKYPIHAVSCNPGVIDTGMQETIRNTSDELFPGKSRFILLKKNQELQLPEVVAQKIYDTCLSTKENYVTIT